MKKDQRFTFRLTQEVMDRIKAAAEAEHRSASQWVEMVILEALPPARKPAPRKR